MPPSGGTPFGLASPVCLAPLGCHLKHDNRLGRCFLKGFAGDNINLMLAAAAWNFRKWMRECASFWLVLLRALSAAQIASPQPA
jgi:hypothetical protein